MTTKGIDAREWMFGDWIKIVWLVSWAAFFVSLVVAFLGLLAYIALAVVVA